MSVPELDVVVKHLEGFAQEAAVPLPLPVTGMTTLRVNEPLHYGAVELPPGEGQLRVRFTYNGPAAAKVWLWHASKLPIVEISPGEWHTFPSYPRDILLYLLANPEQQLMLSWGYELGPPWPNESNSAHRE